MKISRAGSVPAVLAAVALSVATAGTWLPGSSGHLLAASAAQTGPASPESVRRLLNRYCVACHNERRVTAVDSTASVLDSQIRETGLALDVADAERPSADAELWERVIARLRAGSMPPAGRPPSRHGGGARGHELAGNAHRPGGGCEPEPGQDRLDAPPEPYRVRQRDPRPPRARHRRGGAAARGRDIGYRVRQQRRGALDLDRATGNATCRPRGRFRAWPPASRRRPIFARFENSVLLTQADRRNEDLPLGSRGGLSATHHFPADGNYIFRIALTTNWQDYVRGMGRRNILDLRIDGRLVRRFHGGGRSAGYACSDDLVAGRSGRPRMGAVRPRVGRPPGGPRAGRRGAARRRGLVRPETVGSPRAPCSP